MRPPRDQIVDVAIRWCRLAEQIDWDFLDGRNEFVCQPGRGQPGLSMRLGADLLILKHVHNLSDEAPCAHWIKSPFCRSPHGSAVLLARLMGSV